MKRRFHILLLLGLFLFLFPTSSLAKTIIVKESVVNVRRGPGKEFKVIDKVKKGREFKVLDETQKWIKIELPEDEKGWVNKSFVEILGEKSTMKDESNYGTLLISISPFRYCVIDETPPGNWTPKEAGRINEFHIYLYNKEKFKDTYIKHLETLEAMKNSGFGGNFLGHISKDPSDLQISGFYKGLAEGDFTNGGRIKLQDIPPGNYYINYAVGFTNWSGNRFAMPPDWGPYNISINADDTTFIRVSPKGWHCSGKDTGLGDINFIERWVLGME